ncbi:autophagy-related protein 18 [[Candida] railenensis]|uniref:Autophagy-related protein 18 n=1 Tax=[Candida] railenensis TaxID=45579 RepID=A0A9P0QQ17_9ASCO|nr:autophagy-related protein 18 [[Candida] railenensis]
MLKKSFSGEESGNGAAAGSGTGGISIPNNAQSHALSLTSSNNSSTAKQYDTLQHHDPNTSVNYITFNQDSSCVAVGLSNGYKIFNCKNSSSTTNATSASSSSSQHSDSHNTAFGKCFQHRKEESVGIIEMLYCTSLLAIVSQGDELGSSPRKLRIINTKRNSTICDLTFPTTILRVKLTKQRMIVLLEEQIYIYDITTMKLLHTIETSPNLNGLITLSLENCDSMGNCYLAYPSPPKSITHDSLLATGINTNGGSNSIHANIQSVSNTPNRVGDVIIFNVNTLQPLSVIEAHKSTLAAICLSNDGTLLATASDKGTIIRVFSVETGVKLFQFRRGTYPTKIYSLNFNKDNRYVVATSSSETVHIFRLGEDEALVNKQRRNSNKKIKLNIAGNSGSNNSGSNTTIREEDEEEKTSLIEEGDDDEDSKLLSIKKLQIPRKGSSTTATSTTTAGTVSFDDNDEEMELEIGDDGDDSDADEEDGDNGSLEIIPVKQRKLSQGSTNSFTSINSNMSLHSNEDGSKESKAEPIVDSTRISMARLIRRSSQKIGRKAAQKMGDFLPSRFSSILEPTRHFASLKINTVGKDIKSIAVMNNDIQEDLVPKAYITSREAAAATAASAVNGTGVPMIFTNGVAGSSSSSSSKESISENKEMLSLHLIHIQVVTSEGFFYTYGLDPERGGDCILLHQYSLLHE